MRSILCRILRRAGYAEVIEASNGQEALDALDLLSPEASPDVALVDWNMPVMNGLELVIAMRKNTGWRRIAIVMVTTENEQSNVVRALAAGAHEYLIKPFDEAALLDKLAILGFGQPEPTTGHELAGNLPGGFRQ